MAEQEKREDSNEAVVNYGLLSLLYEIRVAAGDKGGKLMQEDLVELIAKMREDCGRLNYIETYLELTNRDGCFPMALTWNKGRTLREACDKYMARDAKLAADGK